jgi:hypothetical protein
MTRVRKRFAAREPDRLNQPAPPEAAGRASPARQQLVESGDCQRSTSEQVEQLRGARSGTRGERASVARFERQTAFAGAFGRARVAQAGRQRSVQDFAERILVVARRPGHGVHQFGGQQRRRVEYRQHWFELVVAHFGLRRDLDDDSDAPASTERDEDPAAAREGPNVGPGRWQVVEDLHQRHGHGDAQYGRHGRQFRRAVKALFATEFRSGTRLARAS